MWSSCMWGPPLGDPALGWCGLLLLYVVLSYIAWSGLAPGVAEVGWCGLVLLCAVRSYILSSVPAPGGPELGWCGGVVVYVGSSAG